MGRKLSPPSDVLGSCRPALGLPHRTGFAGSSAFKTALPNRPMSEFTAANMILPPTVRVKTSTDQLLAGKACILLPQFQSTIREDEFGCFRRLETSSLQTSRNVAFVILDPPLDV